MPRFVCPRLSLATLIVAVGAVATGGVLAGPAFASSSETANISAGALSTTPPTSLAWTDTLNGTDQAVLAVGTPNNSVVVTDARGIKTAGGWNVTTSTTAFASTGTPADSIPGTPLVINGSNSSATASTAPVATCGAGSTCLLPSGGSAITYPLTLITTPTKVYSAGNATGQGVISLASDFWLNIAATTLAHADYTATATIAVVSGP